MKKSILFMLLVVFSVESFANLTITYRAPSSDKDVRFKYPLELVKTAMEKTENEYGSFKLVPSPIMNLSRATSPNFIGKLDNFIFETSATKEKDNTLLPIKIPLYKGLFGYRLFLIDKKNQAKFSRTTSLNDLKKFTIGQGRTWSDVKILEANNFRVIGGATYEGLFNMLLSDRFDLFSRGVHEAFKEKKARPDMTNLAVEEDLCLYYPLPRYFYTAKKNTLFAERLEKGLNMMIDDGTFEKIWLEYYSDIVKQANFKNRKIFKVDNPLIPNDVPFEVEKYWFNPEN